MQKTLQRKMKKNDEMYQEDRIMLNQLRDIVIVCPFGAVWAYYCKVPVLASAAL